MLAGGQMPDGFLGCLLFEECELECRMENAAEGRWSVANFSSLPFYSFSLSFLLSFAGVTELWCSWFSGSGTRVFVWRMVAIEIMLLDLESAFSAAGLHISIFQNGLRCKSTRTAPVFLSAANG